MVTQSIEKPVYDPSSYRHPDGHFAAKGVGDRDRYAPPDTPLAEIPTYRDTAEMVEAIHRDGYVILTDVLDRDEVAELRAFMDRLADPDDSVYDVPKWCYNRSIANRYHEHPEFLRYIDRPHVIDIADGVLGEDCRVKGGVMWVTGPGREMGIHSDWQPVALPEDIARDPRVRMPVFWLQAHCYLNDLTRDMGPTVVVPGSHRAGRSPVHEIAFDGQGPVAAVVPAGSMVIFRSDLWHGGFRHSNEERRYIMQIQYGHRMLATNVPPWQYPELWNPAVREQATPRQRRLLGEPQHDRRHDDYGRPLPSKEMG